MTSSLTVATPTHGHYARLLGEFGESWFRTVCEVALLSAHKVVIDEGIDFHVVTPEGDTTLWQVKTTESARWTRAGLSLSLPNRKLKNITETMNTRAFIAIVPVRAEHPHWHGYVSGHPHGSTIVRACGYFSETGVLAQPTNETSSTTIKFARTDVLTANSLHELLNDD